MELKNVSTTALGIARTYAKSYISNAKFEARVNRTTVDTSAQEASLQLIEDELRRRKEAVNIPEDEALRVLYHLATAGGTEAQFIEHCKNEYRIKLQVKPYKTT